MNHHKHRYFYGYCWQCKKVLVIRDDSSAMQLTAKGEDRFAQCPTCVNSICMYTKRKYVYVPPPPAPPTYPEGSEHICFLHIPDYCARSFEQLCKRPDIWQYVQVVWVSKSELRYFKKGAGFRPMCTWPALTAKNPVGQLKGYAGAPKFNFGLYYDINDLYYMEDVISYNNSNGKINKPEDVRTAKWFVNRPEKVEKA